MSNTKPFVTEARSTFTVHLMGSAAAAALLAAGPVHAQTAGAAASADTGPGVVTITAERRSENLQRVPLSATVRSGAELKNENVYGIQQLQNQTPGLSIQAPLSSETYINIRGVGIQQTAPVSSNGVAFYVDGMYVPSLIDTVDTFYDLQNVEVLRGPQGTLVGSNADGGAIFVNSVQPSFDRVKGYIQQTIGNYNDYRTEGGINLPISDKVAARLGFVYETRGSFTRNIGAQSTSPVGATYPPAQNQPGDVDFNAMRLQVAFRPTDTAEFTIRFEPYQSRTDGFAVKPDEAAALPLAQYYGKTSLTYPNGPFYDPWAYTNQSDAFLIDYDQPQSYVIVGQRTSGTLVWHLTPALELKDIVSYQSGYESDRTDSDASSAPGNEYLTRRASFSDYTEELNLLSTGSGPFQWVAGFYYLNTTGPLVLSFRGPTTQNLSVISYHQTYAGFVSGTYQFTPQWSLTVGGRYSTDNQPRTEVAVATIHDQTFTTGDREPTGTVKLNFQVTPRTLIYASVSNGYKAGGDNLDLPPTVIVPPYKPETNVVEELGLKTDFLNHHMRFDGDVFDSQYQNFQIQETLTSPIVTPYTQNVSEAAIWGVEGELTGQFDDLQFNLGVSYLNAVTAKAFNFVGPTAIPYMIPKGTAVPFAPEWMLTAGLQYGFHVGNGLLTPRLQYQYQDSQFVTIAHNIYPLSIGTTIPAHGTLDFLLTYAAPEHWQIQGYVTNLLNSTYIATVQPSATAGMVPLDAYGAPLQYGVRLSYNF